MINKIKAIKRCMLPCVLSATLASTIVTPVNAQQNETYNPVRDLQFTSELNTDESHISTASEESVELKSDVKYNEDKSSATMTITAPEGYVLSLSDDWKASYKTFLDDGTIVLQNENTNTLSITTNIKAIYRLEVNVKDKDNTLTTQNIDFQALDIVSAQSDEQQEETNVADSPAGEVNSRTVNSSVQTSHDSKSLGVSYTGTDSYVWSIPSEINLNNQDTLTVSATKANEEANASLKIVVSSENGFNMKSDTGRMGAYKITKDGNQITNNSTILETTSSGTSTADLKFTANPANFMTADTYNDTLTFKAQNGYTTGTVLEIEGMKFIVMGQTDDDTYMLIDGESLGNIQYQPNVDSDGNYKIGAYETSDEKRPDGQYSSTYEGSYIDNYLENTWYKQLSEKLQKAIQATDIKQTSYKHFASNPKWKYFDPNGGSSNDWYYNEGTTENPKWVVYYKANFPDDEQGAYPLNRWKQSEKGHNNTSYNTISRHVFLPSVEEVSNLVDLNNANKIYNFLKGTNNSLYHMWFRDSYSSSSRYAMHLSSNNRSMNGDSVTSPWVGVRPAFTVDLSKVNATVVDTVKYK